MNFAIGNKFIRSVTRLYFYACFSLFVGFILPINCLSCRKTWKSFWLDGMIEFPNSFLPGDPKRDPQLLEKLTTPEELSGILNWCLAGLQRLLEQGTFTVGETLEEQEDRWIVEGDSVKAFYERCTQEQIGVHTPKSVAYTAYTMFCQEHKVTPLIRRRFTRELR